jgi:hypothetical protein
MEFKSNFDRLLNVIQYDVFLVPYVDYETKSKSNVPVAMLIRCVVYIRGLLRFTLPFMLQVFFFAPNGNFLTNVYLFQAPQNV